MGVSSIDAQLAVAGGGSIDGLLSSYRERTLSYRPALEATVATHRAIVKDEFEGGYWLSANGRKISWADTVPFGDHPGGASNLERSGALKAAWVGTGPGAFAEYSDTTARWGVSTKVHPQAGHLRGGLGKVRAADARILAAIKVSPKMRVFLGKKKGVWLKPTTTHLYTQPRPHATANPLIRTRGNAILNAYIAGRRTPDFPSVVA